MKAQTAISAKRKPYDSDLADAQWGVIEPTLPPPNRRGGPRADLREIICAARRTLAAHAPPRPAAVDDRPQIRQKMGSRRNAGAHP